MRDEDQLWEVNKHNSIIEVIAGCEEMEFSSDGASLNAGFRRYKILNAADAPPLNRPASLFTS